MYTPWKSIVPFSLLHFILDYCVNSFHRNFSRNLCIFPNSLLKGYTYWCNNQYLSLWVLTFEIYYYESVSGTVINDFNQNEWVEKHLSCKKKPLKRTLLKKKPKVGRPKKTVEKAEKNQDNRLSQPRAGACAVHLTHGELCFWGGRKRLHSAWTGLVP